MGVFGFWFLGLDVGNEKGMNGSSGLGHEILLRTRRFLCTGGRE